MKKYLSLLYPFVLWALLILVLGAAKKIPVVDIVAISGSTAWFDASDIRTITIDSSNRIASWKSKIGNNPVVLAQTTDAQKPVYTAGIANGLAVARFDGDNDNLTSATTAASLFTTTATTIFVVVKDAAPAQEAYLFYSLGTAAFSLGYRTAGASVVGWYHSDAGGFDSITRTSIANQVTVYCAQHDGTNITFTKDNSNFASTASGNTAAGGYPGSGVTLGRSALSWEGDIAELITFNRVLSSVERASVFNYLKAKWGDS